jgi:RHS repeat-associated protein
LISGIQDAAGNQLTIQRDAAGRITGLFDQIGVNTHYGYDTAGRVTQETDALSKTRVFTRDVMGRITQVQTARGGTLGFVYDKDNRRVSEYMDGQKVAEFIYASNGPLTSMVDAWGTTSYAHDKNGRVKSITYPDGKTLAYTYNANGMPLTATYPGGLTVTYQYNTRNRLIKAAWGGDHISFIYDAAGSLLTETRSNGTSTDYSKDALGRMTGITHKRGSATLANLSFNRDSAGRITKQNMVLPNDPALPAQGSQATYNTAGQLTSFANATWSYDADGNAKNVIGGISGTFTHDSFNRLSTTTWGGVNASFLYDGKGNRVRIVRGGQTRYLHYNQMGQLMFETDGSNALVACYVNTDGRLSAIYKPSEGSYFYHFDQNGSTLAITDTAGATKKTYAYLPFGTVVGGSGSMENRFTYVGAWGVNDDGNGLFFMRNRMYDAGARRFLERDPIGWNGGENLYAYVGGNPVNLVDPKGLDDFEVWSLDGLDGGLDEWYEVDTAEGTQDLEYSYRTPHMADPATDEEMIMTGATLVSMYVLGGLAVKGISAAPAVCHISTKGQAYMDKLMQTYQGKIPGGDSRSSVLLDWLVNAPITAKDKTRAFTGAIKYINK